MKLKDSFREMKITPKTYFLILTFATVIFGIVIPAAISMFLAPYLHGPIVYTINIIPMFIIFVVGMYPLMLAS